MLAPKAGIALSWNLDHSVRIRFSEDGEYIFRTQASATDGTANGSQSQEQIEAAASDSRDAARIDRQRCEDCLGTPFYDVFCNRSFRQERDHQEEYGSAL